MEIEIVYNRLTWREKRHCDYLVERIKGWKAGKVSLDASELVVAEIFLEALSKKSIRNHEENRKLG